MISLKLRSRTGASLIVTLLLFLVCSTVGSIILTAATANVGRISERAEYDRKYYKVISAVRLFADEIAGKTVTLTLTRPAPDVPPSIDAPPSIPDAGDKLSAILLNDIYEVYTGRKDSPTVTAMAEKYWAYDFSDIGVKGGDYVASRRTSFTMAVDDDATVYGRMMVEATRKDSGLVSIPGLSLDPSLTNVTHNVTAVFYSDPDENSQIPENAYVVKLICPADAVYPTTSTGASGEQMSITFRWTRENMKIEQVRGVA